MVDPLSYFSFQPVLHNGRGMCYPVCGMVHIKEPLLLMLYHGATSPPTKETEKSKTKRQTDRDKKVQTDRDRKVQTDRQTDRDTQRKRK